jgi:1,4-alpha-glucan branching enzyme
VESSGGGRDADYQDPTGGYVDNESSGWAPRYHEEQVRLLFVSSAVMLLEEFHLDGFRLDQTTAIHPYNRLHRDGSPVGGANVARRSSSASSARPSRRSAPR